MMGDLGGILREREGETSRKDAVARRRGRRDPKEARRLRPLPAILALGAAGSFAAALVPGFNGARCVRRAVALAAVALYAWMVV
jgi:hypothetical protein